MNLLSDPSIHTTVAEYQRLLGATATHDTGELRPDQILRVLQESGDWTEAGAKAVVGLANDYGVFMLRNALALAMAMGKEDGDLNF